MKTRRELLRYASLATAAGCAPSLTRHAYAAARSTVQESLQIHRFNAEAMAIRGSSGSQQLPTLAYTSLDRSGGFLAQSATNVRVGKLVSFVSAYTEVSGSFTEATKRGAITTSTSVIEGLNIADFVTADRIISQISTEHPIDGHVPTVSFSGTRFENLRIAGKLVEFDLDLNMLGERPAGDVPYLSDPGFRSRAQSQRENLVVKSGGTSSMVEQLPVRRGLSDELEFSLVHSTSGISIGQSYGNVIHVPGFGTVHLAKVKITQNDTGAGTPPATTIGLTPIQTQPDGGGTIDTPATKTNGGKGG